MMAENSPELLKAINSQIQEVQQIPSRRNKNNPDQTQQSEIAEH